MSVNVLILEDKEFTRRVIETYLSSNLARDASERDNPNPDAVGGQLAHILPDDWEPFRRGDFRVCSANDDEIEALLNAAKGADRERIHKQVSSICVESFATKPQLPDVLVVDLALNGWEQIELMNAEKDWPSMTCQICDRPKPDSVPDPRDQVEEMTGFKVIRALAGEGLPIIATSYASHPLVPDYCLISGARAFVRKPVREEEEREGWEGWDWKSAAKYEVEQLEALGRQAEEPLAVVLLEYLTTLTAHILAALPILALRQLNDCESDRAQGAVPTSP